MNRTPERIATSPHTRFRRAFLVLLAGVLGLAVVPLSASTASADLPDQLVFDGRGWGHGRGMSQYGAQGYATKYGWTSARILDHYYGGTTAGQASTASNRPVDPDRVRIRLHGSSGKTTRVTVTNGTLEVTGIGALSLPAGTKAVHLSRKDSGGFDLYAATKTTCTDTDFSFIGNTGTASPSTVDIRTTVPYSGKAADMLRLCTDYGDHGPAGASTWYPGLIRTQVLSDAQQTTNITTIEQQLRSVVPRESPSSWANAALEAQSVAARSYALAGDNRWPAADTCDTIFCQVYAGHFRADPNGVPVASTATSTDTAIKNTAGVVRLTASNTIARTEFSSTSGGWTAGGTFRAVEDLGDAISPRHTWRCTVSIAPLETTYGKGASLTSFRVTERNGLGPDGGRVLKVALAFSNGTTTTVTGGQVRSALTPSTGSCTDATGRTFASGLLSDWFTPLCLAEADYIDSVHQLFVRRSATGTDLKTWCTRVQEGDRIGLTNALSVTDEWAGVQIADLYRKVLDRDPEAGGREYWRKQVANGMRIEDIAAYFYGSDEYFRNHGSSHRGFIAGLYDDLLGRTADRQGLEYWVDLLDRRRVSRTGAAENFYASVESRGDRVDGLYDTILGRAPDPSGRRFWIDQLLRLGDVKLAANLAASQEYFDRATS